MSVKKGFKILIITKKSRIYTFICESCCQRHITSSQSLRQTEKIRTYAIMLTGKHFARSTESCEDFIEDQKDLIGITPFAELTESSFRPRGECQRLPEPSVR